MSWIDQILIVDTDSAHSAELETALLAANYRVSVCSEHSSAIDAVKAGGVSYIVIVSRARVRWRVELEVFCGAIGILDPRPPILCVLCWPPRGPKDRLYGDSLDVTVLHEG